VQSGEGGGVSLASKSLDPKCTIELWETSTPDMEDVGLAENCGCTL
jgi:hypothetical protein